LILGMSSGGNTWEVVKGFCRRRTQQFREEVSKDAAPTVDPDVEGKCRSYTHLRTTAATIGTKLRELNMHVAGANRCILEISQALKTPIDGADDELDIISKKLEVYSLDVAEKERALSAALVDSAAELSRFVEEANQYEALQELRKDNMLEYDFFRDKVAKLRESPPSDGTRIPRNEMRLEDWKVKYQDATNRLMNFMNNSAQGGKNGLRGGMLGLTGQYGRYCEDVGRSARAVLGGGGNPGSMVQSAARTVAAAAPQVAQNLRRGVEAVQSQQQEPEASNNTAASQQQQSTSKPKPPPAAAEYDPFSM